jgi:hypothetical protein
MEIWKEIPGFEGLYEASTYGRIKSLSRIMYTPAGGMFKSKERMLKLCFNDKYLQVCLFKKVIKVHRLVALTFIPNPNNYPLVMHLDDNPSNNHVDNLRWGTPKHNSEDRNNKDRQAKLKGEKNGASKLTEQQVEEIKSKLSGKYGELTRLSKEYNVSITLIYYIRKNKNWTHI